MNTQEQEIITVVGELLPDDGASLAQQHGPQALTVAREMESALTPVLEANPAYAPLWQQFRADPQTLAPALAGVLQVLLAADAALARRLDALLAQYRQAARPATNVNTGGGAYVGGSVTVERGDFVGRDNINISGDGNVIGNNSRSTVFKQSADPEALARAFGQIYAAVAAHPATSPADKADMKAELEEVEQELAKGEAADEDFLTRHLRNVGRMAPDILEVALATIASPVAGLGLVAKKVADKVRGKDKQ